MILSGGLVVKRPDIIEWRGTTQNLPDSIIDRIGGGYGAAYRRQPMVTAAVNKRAKALSRLPLKTYRRTPSGREDARATPYGQLIARPNPRVDPVTFWFWVQAVKDTYGESFLGKVRDRGGRPVELKLLHPMYVKLDENTGQWSYDNGQAHFDIARRDLIWFRHFNPDGPRGLSPLEPLRSTLENEYGARAANSALWRNGARPGAFLQHPKKLTQEAATRLRMQWDDIHGSVENWAKTAVLEEGMTVVPYTLNVEELQYVEARLLNREEVCAVYDLPPAALQDMRRATFSNITENLRSLYRDTMGPEINSCESVIELELRDGRMGADGEPDFPDDVYAEFLMDEVLRGSFEARAQAYQMADWMTVAEKRSKENLPFIEGTDNIFMNAAQLPLTEDGTLAQPEPVDQPIEQPAVSERALRTVMGRLGRAKSLADLDLAQFTAGLNGDSTAVSAALTRALEVGESIEQFKHRLKNLTEA